MPKCDTRNDAEEWKAIRHACKVLMFTDEELFEIIRILSIVLHLGNIQYNGTKQKQIENLISIYLFSSKCQRYRWCIDKRSEISRFYFITSRSNSKIKF